MMIEQDECYNNSFQQYVTQKSTGVTKSSSFANSQVPKVFSPRYSANGLFTILV
jgi:hypothetical protein